MQTSDTSDLRAAGVLAGRGLAATTGLVRDVHVGIARRVFRASGPVGRPAHVVHDAISRTVYAAVAGGVRVGAHAAGAVAAARSATDPAYRPLADRPRGNAVVGALNGAWGDLLSRTENPLALTMTVRRDDRDVDVTGPELAAAFPDASGHVVVFLHGLCETDRSWRLKAVEHYGDPASTHGARLQRDLGATPVYLRYNTGLHISDNGAALQQLLASLVEAWPVEIERLTLVGHSMGGLVIRSATHQACAVDGVWVRLVRTVVYLGSPHLGAPLELGAAAATRALRRLPETQSLGAALAGRSVGIKDLRFGDVLADDWSAFSDLDARRDEPAQCAPLLDSADHFYVGATFSRRHDTLAGRLLGDGLVLPSSSAGTGRRRRLGLQVDRGRHLGGLHHFDLLNHPRVYSVLRDWLEA